MWYYAVTGGTAAAISAVFAKLAFTDTPQILFCIYIMCYISCNILMWWAHTAAMRESSSALKAVAINTATNFVLTGVMGNFIFGEVHSLRWWLGISFIFCGAMVVIRSQEGKEKEG